MTYFITGANGFLGSYLIKNILERTTDRIIATDLKCPKDNSNGRIKWLPLDITDEKQMKSVFKHTQTEQLKVLFLAAYLHPDLVEKIQRLHGKSILSHWQNFLKSSTISILFIIRRQRSYMDRQENVPLKKKTCSSR